MTKRFDANRQEAGITVGNIIQTLQVTGQIIEGAKEAYAIANKIEQENQKLSSEDQLLFGNLIIELSKSKQEQDRLRAAACALVKCSEGVPESDVNYKSLKAFEALGET
ncbi:UNVERIFIED_CONTAM: hypothetical protein GN151_06120 [Acinetobacter sp. HSTU-ASm16]